MTPLSDANVVIGSAGGSTIGDRISRAVAVEASLPVLDNLDITLAARYDSYFHRHYMVINTQKYDYKLVMTIS